MTFLVAVKYELIDENGPMRPVQIAAVALCILMNLVDGFDVLALTFTAPAVAAEWRLTPGELGLLFSASLAGMAIGALALSPIADRHGRRRAILISLTLVALGMIVAALAPGRELLLAGRVLTGLGVGPLISSTTATVHEFSSLRRRGLGMGLMAVAFPAGATIGGGVALLLIETAGWRSVFAVGAIATVALLPLAYLALPESPAYLQRAGRADASVPVDDPLAWGRTVRLGALFAAMMMSFYFVQTWLPKLLVQLGQPFAVAGAAGIMLNMWGMVGGLAAGLAMSRLGVDTTARWALGTMALGIAVIGIAARWRYGPLVDAALLGFAMFAAMASTYALLSESFSAYRRATAIGIVSTAGRIGSAIGPILAGWLLSVGVGPEHVGLLLALPSVGAGLLAQRTSAKV
jgi:MFS family permease